MSPSLIGIDPEYNAKELARDMERNGGYNETVDYRSGKAPANTFKNIIVAKPAREYRDLGPQFVGTSCIDRYPLDHCPFPGVCAPAEKPKEGDKPCAVWGEGKPASLGRFIEDKGLKALSTFRGNETLNWDIPGRWSGDLWHPGTSKEADPDYHFFTPEDLHQCFRGQRIVFQGDSITRQLFSRLAQYLRLLPVNCEHVFSWSTASYQVFEDGHDKFTPDCHDHICNFPDNALYTIMYDWHNENNETENFQRLINFNTTAAVHAITYWKGSDHDLLDSWESMDKLFAPETSSWRGQFSWLLTPEKSDWPDQYDKRNNDMRDKFKAWGARGRKGLNLIPMDRLVRTGNGRDIVRDRRPVESAFDDVHFMCDYTNTDLYQPIKPGLQNLKAPMNFDARDMVNLNGIQVWANSICKPGTLERDVDR